MILRCLKKQTSGKMRNDHTHALTMTQSADRSHADDEYESALHARIAEYSSPKCAS